MMKWEHQEYIPGTGIWFVLCCGLLVVSHWSLRWRHNEHDGVSNHQCFDCLLDRLFRPRSKKTPKLRVTGLCEGNSPVTSEFPTQKASNAENVSIWWRHHDSLNLNWIDWFFPNPSGLLRWHLGINRIVIVPQLAVCCQRKAVEINSDSRFHGVSEVTLNWGKKYGIS